MGPHVGCRLKFLNFVVRRQVSVIFLPLVGNFFFVLSVFSNVFRPFAASRLTPFTDPVLIYFVFLWVFLYVSFSDDLYSLIKRNIYSYIIGSN